MSDLLLRSDKLTASDWSIFCQAVPLENKISPHFEVCFYIFFSNALSFLSVSFFYRTSTSSFYEMGFIIQVLQYIAFSFLIFIILSVIIGSKFIQFVCNPAKNYLVLPKQGRYNNNFFWLLFYFAIIGGFSLGICLRTGLLMNPYLFYLIRTQSLIPSSFYLILTTFLGSIVQTMPD